MPNPIKVWHLTGGGNGKKSPPSQLDDTARRLLAGGASGVVTKSMTAPLERIKILLQLRSMSKVTASSSSSILGTMRSVLRDDGIRGFWKGNGANCTRVVPVYALKFALYDKIKDLFRSTSGAKLSILDKMKAGTLAGVTTLTLTYPLDMIRTRLALSSSLGIQYKGIVDCARATVQKEGFLGLYKGYIMTFLSGSPYVGLQMSGYEVFKGYMPVDPVDGSMSPAFKALAGMCANVTAQTITFPGDVLRKRMQTNGAGGKATYSGNLDCMRHLYRADGLRGFYSGLGANLVRSLPAAAIQFVAYETCKEMLGVGD